MWTALVGLAALNSWWVWRDRAAPTLRSANALLAHGKNAEAETILQDLVRRSPHDGDAREAFGRVLARRGDLVACAEQLSKVPFWWPTKSDALLREGQTWREAGFAARAERAWIAYLRDDPNHPITRTAQAYVETDLINLWSLEDRWSEVRDLVWAIHDRAEPSAKAEFRVMALRTRLERSNPSVSARELRPYVTADPTDWRARQALARAVQTAGDSAEADRLIRACLLALPNDVTVWRDWFTVLSIRNDLDVWSSADAVAPAATNSDPAVWRLRGLVRERTGRLEFAAEAYRKSLELDPFDAETHHRLDLIDQQLGLAAQASEHRRRFQQLQAANSALSAAFDDYIAAFEESPVDVNRARAASKGIADNAATLGWRKDAEAWSAVAIGPPARPGNRPGATAENPRGG